MFHPLCFAAAFVLYVGIRNEVAPAGLARPLLVAVVAALVLIGLGWATFRNRWDGALAASIFVLVTISLYPLIFAWDWLVARIGVRLTVVIFFAAAFTLLAVPAVLTFRAIRQSRHIPRPPPGALNAFGAAVLLVVIVGNAGPYVESVLLVRAEPAAVPIAEVSSTPPDIYLVILDGYSRQDVLQERFGIDNSDFIEGLRARGFAIDDQSLSNYVFTPLTLLSMFDMRHLEDIPVAEPVIGLDGPHHGKLRAGINAARTFEILNSAGYEVVVSSNGHEHVALRDVADRLVNGGELTDFELGLIERTWLLDAIGLVAPNFLIDADRNRVLAQFETLNDLATEERDRPMFAFVHIPSPHLPLALTAEGETLPLGSRNYFAQTPEQMEVTFQDFLLALAGEIRYVDERILEAVDRIQSVGHSPEPVIVLMSDHGLNYPVDADPNIRLKNLLAAYTPGADGLLVSSTPVNLLARVFNAYLGTGLEVAEDRYFNSPTDSRLMLRLTEVSNPD